MLVLVFLAVHCRVLNVVCKMVPDVLCSLLCHATLCCALCVCMHASITPTVYSAHMREKALEALLWFTQLPAPRGRPPLLTPQNIVQWMSTGTRGRRRGGSEIDAKDRVPSYNFALVLHQRPCLWLLLHHLTNMSRCCVTL